MNTLLKPLRVKLLWPLVVVAAPLAASAAEYTLLIYEAPAELAKRTDASTIGRQYWDNYAAYGRALTEAGILRGGAPLQAATMAKTTRLEAGRSQVTSGPHTASVQTLGGFFIVEVDSLDRALAWAAKAPAAATGGAVEVRPNMPSPAMP